MAYNQNKTVAIIDSGAGGLSVAKEIIDRKLNADIQYVADKQYFPYGTLEDDALIQRLIYLVTKIHQLGQADIIIVACNTASTLALPTLRARWNTPFIGVVPAVKPAAELSRKNKIAVLATQATVSRAYLVKLIEEHAQDTVVSCFGSQKLVELAELYVAENKVDINLLNAELTQLTAPNQLTPLNPLTPLSQPSGEFDQLVLACTHFPILKPMIAEALSPLGINVVDSTSAIVNRLCSLLPDIQAEKFDENTCKASFYSSGSDCIASYARYVFSCSKPNAHFNYNF